MLSFIATILGIVLGAFLALVPFLAALAGAEAGLRAIPLGRRASLALVILTNLRRNRIRTALAYLATFVLVVVVILVWSSLYYMDSLVAEKASNLKLIVSDRWQLLSEMPFSYADSLCRGAADPTRPGDVLPQDSMTWQLYLGTLDRQKADPDSQVILIAIEPSKMPTMMAELIQEFSPAERQAQSEASSQEHARLAEAARRMQADPRLVLIGRDRLKQINKRLGDRFQVTGVNFQDIDLEFEIGGLLPPGVFDQLAVMNRDYLNAAIEAYPRTHGHRPHPLAQRSLNRVWLRVPDQQASGRVAWQVESSAAFRNPAVKCETMSSDIATKLDLFRDLTWGMRWLLAPAVLITMVLVIANAISISVRERRAEIAVLKVLGFRPAQLLALILGEGMLIGAASGFFGCAGAYVLIDWILERFITLALHVPLQALAWGPILGAGTALLGSLLPACAATTVKVTDVFSKVG